MSLLSAAIERGDIALYVNNLFTVFIIIIFARIVVSWIVTVRGSIPYNAPTQAVVGFLESTVDPYLRVFRRFLPPVGAGRMSLDLSPIIGVFLLLILQPIIVGLIN